MRTSGEHLSSPIAEGRFDEASQRDVLELAARLQRMHLETMSADEIERAAVEGGMNAEFVREAIRRVSVGGDQQESSEEEQEQKAHKGEWGVIFVPIVVLGFFGLRYMSRHGELTGMTVALGVLALLTLTVLGLLAAIGVKSLMSPKSSALGGYQALSPAESAAASITRRELPKLNAFSLLFQALIAFALLTVPMSWPNGGYNQAVFILIVLPLVGAWEPRIKAAFWKGFTYYALMGFLGAVGTVLVRSAFDQVPIYIGGFGAIGGIAALLGHGVRRLVYRPAPALSPSTGRSQMLEQLFELQAALERHQETRAFLSVDVVGSSIMKAAGNPLEVEYSFGQYQEWVAQTVRMFGGEVQLSAGDGAMAMFRDARSAIAAAKQIQIGMVEFNATKNRLSTPFAIRCGVAEGKIGIDSRMPLGQIQSPVLDRAAFIQKYAEPGSVVVTKELLEIAMPVLGSLHQRELIDGKPVYFWP